MTSFNDLEAEAKAAELVKGNEIADSMVKEGEVLKQIGETLKGFTPDQQKRIIGAVAVMYGFAEASWKR